MEEVEIREAIKNASANPEARWPSRGPDSRLEPLCWPALHPRFKLNAGATVFTIGSCFARNIERYLAELGFVVPTQQFVIGNRDLMPAWDSAILNRYTPPSIYQDLKWVRGILDRDDRLVMADVEPFLLDVGNGLVCDLGRQPTRGAGTTPEEACRQRRLLYDLFKLAFTCDAMVMTLGLIECWWDRQQQSYVEFHRQLLRHPARFAFRRLDYPAALEFVQATVDLVNRDRTLPILMTTSPVPLSTTFTTDDVIVANTYSKSVLRAVAEAVRIKNDMVDYFPSYESVMLSRDGSVWMDDLIHVQPDFVSSIMLRVTKSYTDLPENTAQVADAMLQVMRHVRQGMWEEARQAYDRIDLLTAPATPVEFYVCAAELMAHEGARAAVIAAVERTGARDVDFNLRCAKALEMVGEGERGRAYREHAITLGVRADPGFWQWIAMLDYQHRVEDLRWVLSSARPYVGSDEDRLWKLGLWSQKGNQPDLAEDYFRAVLDGNPQHEDAGLRLAYLLMDSDRRPEGLLLLDRLASGGCDNLYLHPLVSNYLTVQRKQDARALLDRLITANPEHPGLRQLSGQVQ